MKQPCRVCGSPDARLCVDGPGTWHCYEPALGETFPFQVGLCQRCGHVYGAWRQDLTHLYRDQEYVTCDTDVPVYSSYVPFVLASLARRKRAPRVLEIGFNRGALLKHFYDLGFECHGIEPGEQNVVAARQKMPRATLHAGLFDEAWATRHDAGQFDLIIITSVLEHMPRPIDVLRAIRRCLSPDGRVFIVVPDLAFYTPTWQIPKDKRDQYGCSQLLFFYRNIFLCYAQHINHFSGPSLTRYLAALGLQTVQVANVGNIWISAGPGEPADDSFEFPDLVEYHREMMNHYEQMLQGMRAAALAKLRARRLVCFGAGRDFGYFLDVFRPLGVEVVAVADDAVSLAGRQTCGTRTMHGVRCVRPRELPSLAPDICLATSFDYEDQIAAKARAILPKSAEVLTLTELIYEYDIAVRPFTNFQLLPEMQLQNRKKATPVAVSAAG